MLVPVLLAQSPEPALAKQPTTMEVVGYQRVQHALPNGKPDPAATENYYVRTHSQWFLVLDTDTLPINKQGQRMVAYPDRYYREFRVENQIGEFDQPVWRLFKEINFVMPSMRGRQVQSSLGHMKSMHFLRPASQRLLQFHIRTIVDQMEIRSVGTRSAIRTRRESHWSSSTHGWTAGKPFVPRVEPIVSHEPTKNHVYEAPVLGYGAVNVPNDYKL